MSKSFESTGPLKFFISDRGRELGITLDKPRQGDAGFDLRSAESLTLEPGEQLALPTCLHVAIPMGWVGIIRERSSTGSKRLYTHSGVIDASYRGEIKVLISNGGTAPYEIRVGDRIAQLLIVPCLVECEPCDALEQLGTTERGNNGFGSTGR